MEIAQVLEFWRDAGPEKWFARDDAFDARFRDRFLDAHFTAARGEHESWMASAEGALALLILLDRLPRNCFRGNAHSYATDGSDAMNTKWRSACASSPRSSSACCRCLARVV